MILPANAKKSRLVVVIGAFRIPQRFDINQLQIQLIHKQSGLPAKRPLLPLEVTSGEFLQFRVEDLRQTCPCLTVAFAECGH